MSDYIKVESEFFGKRIKLSYKPFAGVTCLDGLKLLIIVAVRELFGLII